MKKFLFPLVALLLLAACSSSEDTINEPEPPKYKIDSTIAVGDLKLQAYIFEGDYYIEAIDESGNKVFTIKDRAEGYIEDLGFGETKEYPVRGCFLLSALNKNDHLYILVSLYASEAAHPHKFILKIREGKIVKKEYLDIYDPQIPYLHFYPEKIAEWYGEYIVTYSTLRTSNYFISVLDKDLNIIWKNLNGNAKELIKNIETKSYISSSVNNVIYVTYNTVVCLDISKYAYGTYLWQVTITDEEIRVNKSTYSLDGDNVIVDVDATTKAGEKKKYHLVLNKATGELVNPKS